MDPFIVVTVAFKLALMLVIEFGKRLTLTLLVTSILANHAHDTATTDDLALLANFLYRGSNLHIVSKPAIESFCSFTYN